MLTFITRFELTTKILGALVLLRLTIKIIHAFYSTFIRRYRRICGLGKWGIITGATDGIGKALATEVARNGLDVLLISRTESKLKELKQELETIFPVKIRILAHDFTNMDETSRQKIKKEIDAIGDVGILFNNVGISYDYPEYFHDLSDERIESLISLNISSAVWMTKLVLPGMIKNKRGAVVNLSSGSARINVPLLSGYSASKKFLEQFTRCMASEYRDSGISFQCHYPMFVTTKLSKIRRTSWLIPSPQTYARAALQNVGFETLCSPYWPHSLQIALYECIPEFIMQRIAKSQHLGLRKRALQKKKNK